MVEGLGAAAAPLRADRNQHPWHKPQEQLCGQTESLRAWTAPLRFHHFALYGNVLLPLCTSGGVMESSNVTPASRSLMGLPKWWNRKGKSHNKVEGARFPTIWDILPLRFHHLGEDQAQNPNNFTPNAIL